MSSLMNQYLGLLIFQDPQWDPSLTGVGGVPLLDDLPTLSLPLFEALPK